MAPTNPWTANNTPTTKLNDTSFPQLKAETKNGTKSSQYEEIQEDELIFLSAVLGDDFQDTRPDTGAWKRADPSFTLTIKSSDEQVSIKLEVVLTATYPRTAPLLTLKHDKDLREVSRYKIQRLIQEKPKELLDQPMIWELVQGIQEILEEAAKAKALGLELPSLEEERAIHEAEAARAAQKQREDEEKKRQQEALEEQRVLEQMLEDELQRQKAKAKEAKMKNRSNTSVKIANIEMDESEDRLIFDQPITLTATSGDECIFQVVTGKLHLRRGPVSDCFMVRPVVASGNVPFPCLVLKQTVISTSKQAQTQVKKAIQALESDLEHLRKQRNRNVISLFGVHVSKSTESTGNESWQVNLLCEYAEKGSLEELLEISTPGVEKAKTWTIELLQGLKFLHENGVTHEDIHASNILLVRTLSGEIIIKLADGGFQKKLHDLASKQKPTSTMSVAKSAYWLPPELASNSAAQYTQKSDVWNFGIVFVQMLFGLDVQQRYASPVALTESLALSDSLDEFIHKLFKTDPKKRPRAWELSSSEFLATDAPIFVEQMTSRSSISSTDALKIPTIARLRRESTQASGTFSRYRADFVEENRLGRGGFGEVVKARRKLDGQLYAIKKITQKSGSTLTEILKEVRLLSQLNHPYVVRYFTSWTETEELDMFDTDEDTMTTTDMDDAISPGGGINSDFNTSTGGLDFISSSRVPFEFGYDTDEEGSDEDSSGEQETDEAAGTPQSSEANGNGHNIAIRRTRQSVRSPQARTRTTLYISMQYCEKRTLRDLIKRDLYKDSEEIWRLFREILEGLAHVHSLNVVHRDLKPENIFIDGSLDVRIGDFGLATSGQQSTLDKGALAALQTTGDMTSSVGTPYYVAPEIRSSVSGSYNSKVDMYSLGVIFFEMCYRAVVGMERDEVLGKIRQKQPMLPSDFDLKDKATQASIILSLLNHNPKERPSSSELLQSGQLPVQMESETIRQTLAGLSSSSSPYYQKMMTALFSRTRDSATEAKDFAYDLAQSPRSANDLMLQGLVKQKLTSIFRHHGAVESSRSSIFPRSSHYGADAVQLLESSGTLVQLPYDLTLPHARMIAKHNPSVSKTFSFGNVFRVRHEGAQPQSFGEVDFDIVTSSALDLALKEAEVIKVLDEIVASFPSMSRTQMCIHINHSDLLNLVFDFCHIDPGVRDSVAEVLSKLNMGQNTWQKIRNELRSPVINLSTTSVDDLQRFDFRDTPTKAFQRFKKMFEGSDVFEKTSSTIAHLNDVIGYLNRMSLTCKVYVTPLGSLKEMFYRGGILFQVVYDGRSKDVFAAGGRYDSLIREHRPRIGNQVEEHHAVGFRLAWEKLSTSMARLQRTGSKAFLKKVEEELQGIWNTRRCDVLVASFDPSILRTTGLEIVQHLWANDISAEMAADSRSPEDLLSKHRDDHHSWIIIVKQDNILKVKSMLRKDVPDADINGQQLTSWLRAEIREREQREGAYERHKISKFQMQQETSNGEGEQEQDVRLLVAQTKSKKSNRTIIRQQAQAKAAALVQSFLKGPIAAIETNDHIMDQISRTRLSDPDTWRRVSQNASMVDRRYIGEIHDLLKTLAHENHDVSRNAFVYNFRTGSCIYYDLAA